MGDHTIELLGKAVVVVSAVLLLAGAPYLAAMLLIGAGMMGSYSPFLWTAIVASIGLTIASWITIPFLLKQRRWGLQAAAIVFALLAVEMILLRDSSEAWFTTLVVLICGALSLLLWRRTATNGVSA